MGCSVSINVAEPPPKESGTSGASATSEAPVVVAAVVPDEGGGVAAGKVTEATPVAVVLPSAVVESHGIVPEWTKVASSLTWAASQKFVSDKKGRLVTLEEARSFLKNRGSSLYPGEDQWAACVRKDGSKDWVQVGDLVHHVGKSHVDEGSGYPKWGDDASGNPGFARSVMWLPSWNRKHLGVDKTKTTMAQIWQEFHLEGCQGLGMGMTGSSM